MLPTGPRAAQGEKVDRQVERAGGQPKARDRSRGSHSFRESGM